MRGNVVVLVKHAGKALPGVTIEIKTNAGNMETVSFAGVTGFDGTARVTNLSPGEYWLNAELLGIGAAYHCFHVDQRPSRKAKRVLAYEWGDLAPSTRRVAGRLIDSQPRTDGTPLWNITHRVEVPISGAELRLQHPIVVEAFSATSDERGVFAFGSIPNGTYVLHIEGGRTGRNYDPTDLLIKVSATASRSALVLTRQEPGATNCGFAPLLLSHGNSP